MTAQQAAYRTIAAVKAKAELVDLEARITEACDNLQTEIKLSLSEISEMYGAIDPRNVQNIAAHPLTFRAMKSELVSKRYKCFFVQELGGWFFKISWADEIVI